MWERNQTVEFLPAVEKVPGSIPVPWSKVREELWVTWPGWTQIRLGGKTDDTKISSPPGSRRDRKQDGTWVEGSGTSATRRRNKDRWPQVQVVREPIRTQVNSRLKQEVTQTHKHTHDVCVWKNKMIVFKKLFLPLKYVFSLLQTFKFGNKTFAMKKKRLSRASEKLILFFYQWNYTDVDFTAASTSTETGFFFQLSLFSSHWRKKQVFFVGFKH